MNGRDRPPRLTLRGPSLSLSLFFSLSSARVLEQLPFPEIAGALVHQLAQRSRIIRQTS